MKIIITFFSVLLLALGVFAQAPPQKMSYQAVVRNSNNQLIQNNAVGMRISILQGATNGNAVYVETQVPVTNGNGSVTIEIGNGNVVSGVFANIDWSTGVYYLQTEIDPQGANGYSITGVSQLLSVPYALYSGNSIYALNGIDSVSGTGDTLYLSNGQIFVNSSSFSSDYNDLSNQPITVDSLSANGDTVYLSNGQTFFAGGSTVGGGGSHYIGEEFGGGVIFFLWKDASGVEHGLIVDKTDLSAAEVWSNIDASAIGPSAQSLWDGLSNSNAIVAQSGHTNSAASLCLNSTNSGQNDWYLPSIQELHMLWNNYFTVARSLTQISGATQLQVAWYWSSTEYEILNINDAWNIRFHLGAYPDITTKNSIYFVRAIRAF
jgi:hypothetical protein